MSVPVEISESWEFVHAEVVWLHGRWIVYRQLFGTNSERIDLTNWAAPTFFGFIQRVLVNDVQLTLAKLADPAKTQGRENATLESLVTLLEQVDVNAPVKRLKDKLKEYREDCEYIRQRRNKDIAHFDREVQLGEKAEILPNPSREEIETSLKSLRQFMNILFAHYENTQMAYEHFSMLNDGNTLMHRLTQAHRYEQLEELGVISQEDILKSPYSQV